MGRKKSKDTKDSVAVQGQLPNHGSAEPQPEMTPQTPGFDQWWASFSARFPAARNLKHPFEIHLKARGFWDAQDWAAGAKDFGWKID